MRRRGRTTDDASVDLTPMLDVTFIMLIFFIVTASFVKEWGLEVNRPDPDQQQVTPPTAAIVVSIDDQNRVWIGARPIAIQAVRANIEKLHAEDPKAGVVIQATKKSKAETLVGVMDQVRLAGVPNVALAAAE